MLKQWWKKRSLNKRFERVTRDFLELNDNKPERKLCERLLTELQPEWYLKYNVSVGAQVKLSSSFKNLDSMTKYIKNIARLIHRDTLSVVDAQTMEANAYSVDRFLITDAGFYQEPMFAVRQFQEAGLNLCRALESSDTDKDSIAHFQLRVATKLLVEMRKVTYALYVAGATSVG